jgi:putative hemolysin
MSREPALPILAVDDKLGYPADLPALVIPASGKCISRKGLVDMDTDLGGDHYGICDTPAGRPGGKQGTVRHL